MANRGKAAIDENSGDTLFGPQDGNDCILQNGGDYRTHGTVDGTTAVDDIGFYIDSGKEVNTKDLTPEWKNGTFKFVCDTGESTSVYWSTK